MLTSREDIARERVVPIVKDRAWLAEMKQALLDRGAEKTPEHIVEDLNSELVIVYACDTPTWIRYLSPDDLSKLGIEPNELHDLACENLARILPKLQYYGYNGVYMVVAGGDYEASLLLLDSVWSTSHVDVKGDIVVAIPVRDLLIAAGSEDPEGLLKVREMARKAYDEGPYRLTSALFVRSGGRFKVWDEGKHPD